jgi:hypothetical protein
MATLENVNGALPVWVTVKFWAALLVPSHWLGKVKNLEDRLTPGTCSRTENAAVPGTEPEPVTKSSAPSLLKSATTTVSGFGPATKATGAWKVPSPLPRRILI